jgi:hypothetical protein
LFLEGQSSVSLSENNAVLIRAICALLGIHTRITDSAAYELLGDRNDRLVNLCKQAGATCYLSGPAARSYLDEQAFADEGITVTWMDYGSYREYNQPHPPFDHGVSILDLLACTGPEARSFLLHNGRS